LSSNGSGNPVVSRKSALFGIEGELVLARVSVEPRQLEELLDTLAGLDFPVNPELYHRPGCVIVEFPAYARHVAAVRTTLEASGFDPISLDVLGILQAACATA